MYKTFVVSSLVLLAACDDGRRALDQGGPKAVAQEERKSTVLDPQMKALDKAKRVERQLSDSLKERAKQVDK